MIENDSINTDIYCFFELVFFQKLAFTEESFLLCTKHIINEKNEGNIMNRWQKKKIEQKIVTNKLKAAVTNLDNILFPSDKIKPCYKIRVGRRLFFHDLITVYSKNNLKVEIRANEGSHKRPHLHVKVKQQEVSIALNNFEVLAGDLDKKHMRFVLAWAKENMDLLKETWETFHGTSVQVV